MAEESQTLRIDYAKDDINYFNGFLNAVKLLNSSLQLLSNAVDEVPFDLLPDTVTAWRNAVDKDMNGIRQSMYNDLKETYGMSLKIDPDGGYYIHIDDGNSN